MRHPAPVTPRRSTPLVRLALAAVLLAAAGPAALAAQDPCLECHGLRGLGVEGRPLWLHAGAIASSAHGALACADCHKGVEGYPHAPGARVRCDLLCHGAGKSHEAVVAAVGKGPHARVGEPPCLGCHRSDAPVGAAEQEPLCRSCHQDLEPGRGHYPDTAGAFGYWGHRKADPHRRLPGCPDCHGVHDIGQGSAARGRCSAAACHPDAGQDFGELFDHRGDPGRPPWGGVATAVLGLGAAVGLLLLAHSLRRLS